MFGVMLGPQINGQNMSSYITVGDYDDEAFAPGAEIISHEVTGSFHWEIKLVKFSYNGK